MKKQLVLLYIVFCVDVYAGGGLSFDSKDSQAKTIVQFLSGLSLSFRQFKKYFLEVSGHKQVHIDDKTLALFLYATHEDEYGRLYIEDLDYVVKHCDCLSKMVMQKFLIGISKEDNLFLLAKPSSRKVLEGPGFVVEYPEMDPCTGKELYCYSKISENVINKALKELPQKDESPAVELFRNELLAQKVLCEGKPIASGLCYYFLSNAS